MGPTGMEMPSRVHEHLTVSKPRRIVDGPGGRRYFIDLAPPGRQRVGSAPRQGAPATNPFLTWVSKLKTTSWEKVSSAWKAPNTVAAVMVAVPPVAGIYHHWCPWQYEGEGETAPASPWQTHREGVALVRFQLQDAAGIADLHTHPGDDGLVAELGRGAAVREEERRVAGKRQGQVRAGVAGDKLEVGAVELQRKPLRQCGQAHRESRETTRTMTVALP